MDTIVPHGCLQLDQAIELVGRTMFGDNWRPMNKAKRIKLAVALAASKEQPIEEFLVRAKLDNEIFRTQRAQCEKTFDRLRQQLYASVQDFRCEPAFIITDDGIKKYIPGYIWAGMRAKIVAFSGFARA